LPPWSMDATYTTLPIQTTAFDGTAGPKTCTAVEHKSDGSGIAKCKLCYGLQAVKKVTADANQKCFTRLKSDATKIKAFTDKWTIAKPLVVKVNKYWSDSLRKSSWTTHEVERYLQARERQAQVIVSHSHQHHYRN